MLICGGWSEVRLELVVVHALLRVRAQVRGLRVWAGLCLCESSSAPAARDRHEQSDVHPDSSAALWNFLSKQGGAEKSCWRPVLPVTRTDPEQINSNIILVVVRRSMKGLLIFPSNKTLLYICFSKWSNHLTLTKCQKYHADHKNGLSGF